MLKKPYALEDLTLSSGRVARYKLDGSAIAPAARNPRLLQQAIPVARARKGDHKTVIPRAYPTLAALRQADPASILRWCNTFGLLGILPHYFATPGIRRRGPAWLERLRSRRGLELEDFLVPYGVTEPLIFDVRDYKEPLEEIQLVADVFDLLIRAAVHEASGAEIAQAKIELASFSGRIDAGGLSCSTMIDTLGLQLAADLSLDRIHRCRGCERIVIRDRPDRRERFCSEACADRVWQRDYRRQKKTQRPK